MLAKNTTPTAEEIETNFDGNLCRCTGYRPILTAFGKFAKNKKGPPVGCSGGGDPSAMLLHEALPLHFSDSSTGEEWYRPVSLVQFQGAIAAAGSDAKKVRLVCANTADGVVKYMAPENRSEFGTCFIDVSRLPDLNGMKFDATKGLEIGAATTIAGLIDALVSHASASPSFDMLAEHMKRIASVQIRSVASWAGNLMVTREYPEFASDMVTILSAAQAQIEVVAASGSSTGHAVTVSELMALKGDYLVLKATIPILPTGTVFRTFKTSQRHVFAHAIVNLGAAITLNSAGKVTGATLSVGGATRSLIMASKTSGVLVANQTLDQATFIKAAATLAGEIAGNPSTDLRHSLEYRQQLAASFLYKAFLACQPSLPQKFRSALVPFVEADARGVSSGTETFGTVPEQAPVGKYIPKLAARIQASGEAMYPSDAGIGALFGQIVFSTSANAKLELLDTKAALSMPGVRGFVAASSVPGVNQVCPALAAGSPDNVKEKVFFEVGDVVPCVGSMLGLIVADSWAEARRAAKQVIQRYDAVSPGVVTSLAEATRLRRTVPGTSTAPGHTQRGVNLERAGGVTHSVGPPRYGADMSATGTFKTGGQRHFYMETQAVFVTPLDGDCYEVVCSDQDSNFTQQNLSLILGVPAHNINVKVPRAGGAFGGKLTRQMLTASAASIAATSMRRPIRIQNERSDDLQMCAGREPIDFDYTVTFDETGKVDTMDLKMTMDPGYFYGDASGDMSMAVGWSDNCYNYRSFHVTTAAAVTNTPHTTSMRAPYATTFAPILTSCS